MCLEPCRGGFVTRVVYLVCTLLLLSSATLTLDESKIKKFCQHSDRFGGGGTKEKSKLYYRHRHVVINLLNKTSYK